jgi:TPR repeat protein
MLYAEGAVVSKDLNTAFELYKKSAEWGHLFAMYELALMYLDGDPIPEDRNLAFKWMHDAAKEGVSDAAFTLGWMYESGSGCAVDHINAYTWYLIYSKSDFASDIAEDLLRVSSLLSKEEIQKAEDNILLILN